MIIWLHLHDHDPDLTAHSTSLIFYMYYINMDSFTRKHRRHSTFLETLFLINLKRIFESYVTDVRITNLSVAVQIRLKQDYAKTTTKASTGSTLAYSQKYSAKMTNLCFLRVYSSTGCGSFTFHLFLISVYLLLPNNRKKIRPRNTVVLQHK